MEDSKSKMLLAALSQCVAERDEAAANVCFILEHGTNQITDNTTCLKLEFEKICQAELTMEAIQVYYASHCELSQHIIKKEEDSHVDNT